MCLKGKAASPVRGLAALLFMGTAALTGMDLLVRPHPLFNFRQYVWQVKQGVFMQRRPGDIARFVVKVVRGSGNTGERGSDTSVPTLQCLVCLLPVSQHAVGRSPRQPIVLFCGGGPTLDPRAKGLKIGTALVLQGTDAPLVVGNLAPYLR